MVNTDWQSVVQKEVYEPLEAQFPDRPRNLAQVFLHSVRAYADKTALVYEGEEISYRVFRESVFRVADALRNDFGVEAGDRVAILLGSEPVFGISVWASAAIGAVVCPMNVRYQEQELKYQLSQAEPKVIVADAAVLDRILQIQGELPSLRCIFATTESPPENVLPFSVLTQRPVPSEHPFRSVAETDPAFIFYTSGTTGHPKGVINSQRALIYSIQRARDADPENGSSDVLCIPIPLHYTGGCKSFLSLTARGGKCVLLKQWKIDDLLAAVEKYRVTNLFALGSIWALALSSPRFGSFDLSSIRSVLFGGSATPPSVIRQVAEALPHARIVQGYGMTECNGGTVEEDAVRRPESSGLPSATTQIRIVDPDEVDLPSGEVGQILIRNAQIFSGYWRDEDATRASMCGGWYRTGDMGFLTEEGRLHLVGRAKDMIIRGQENVYPAEIESVIMRHPDIQEVAVIGVPDDVLFEKVKAFIVPKPERIVSEEDVLRVCREHLAEYKVPEFIAIRLQPLPRNAGGKVAKKDLC